MTNPADSVSVHPPPPPDAGAVRRTSLRLGVLFATAYFIQGIGEPTAGLIAQPVRSLLRTWEYSPTAISVFGFFVGLPWTIKPLYGLLSDFVPIFGSRRRSYLILTTAATAFGFALMYRFPPASGQLVWFGLMLVVPTLAVAFTDVVVDALMVERGQPLGLTGRLQSIQWAAMYGATILIGRLGGWLSEHGLQMVGFAICSAATGVLLVVAILFVRDSHSAEFEPPKLALRELWQAVRLPPVMIATAFLFLWNFNPFSANIQYLHMVNTLKFSEQFVGDLTSVFAMAAVVGSLAYGFYCRAVPLRGLVHISIAMGVISTLAYGAMHDATSAIIVTLIVGASYITGMLITLDLVARACPVHVAATMFALFMSLSNLSYSLSELAGGPLYEWMMGRWNATIAYNVLVGVGAAFTAACWLLMPWLNERTFAPEEAKG